MLPTFANVAYSWTFGGKQFVCSRCHVTMNQPMNVCACCIKKNSSYITMCMIRFSCFIGNMVFNIFRGPIELLMGVVFGSLVGILCWFLPNKTEVQLLYYIMYSYVLLCILKPF